MTQLQSMTDEQLAMLYVEGNNKAFDLLLERNQDKLFKYILCVVHDEHVANDLFQDTFLKAVTRLQEGRYKPSGKFSAWLIRIAHNLIMDNYRDESTMPLFIPNTQNDLSNLLRSDMTEQSRESQYTQSQTLADVRRIMDQLPDEQREVVFMRYYQNLSFKEIAQQTGVSINTSLGRMRYAILNMRRMALRHQLL